MRNKLNNYINKGIKTIKNGLIWADDHKGKTVLLLVILLSVVIGVNEVFKVRFDRESNLEQTKSRLSDPIEQITRDQGKTVVYETKTKVMTIDPLSTNIEIKDKETGVVWNTLGVSGIVYDNKGIASPATSKYASPITVEYISKSGTNGTFSGYDNSINTGNYTINRIDQGVQITYELMDRTINAFEYLPREIRIERYESEINSKLPEALEEGKITEKDIENFNLLWSAHYDKNVAKESYAYSKASVPTLSNMQLFIKVFTAIGYDELKLIEDNEYFGITTEFEVKTKYTVVIETTLDGDDVLVNIPTGYAESDDEFYQITAVSVYPYFGDINNQGLDDENPGYIFVPDGSGALIELNNFNSNYPNYTKAVYGHNQYDNYYTLPEYQESISMPVFGMYGNLGDRYHGYLGIIEEGAEVASITAQSTQDSATSITINQANVKFHMVQTSKINLHGNYSSQATYYTVFSKKYDYNGVIRYKLIQEEDFDYFDLAQLYRNYLIEKEIIDVHYEGYEPKLYLDLIGNVTIEKHFLGIPYKTNLSMTTYEEAKEIMRELEGVRKVVNYKGAVNDGINQTLLSKIEWVKANGSVNDYEDFKDYLDGEGDELYVAFNFVKTYGDGNNGFDADKHAMIGFNNDPLKLYPFDLATRQFNFESTPYYILTSKYLSDVVDRFIKENTTFDKIAINDLGHSYLVDYHRRDPIDPFQGAMIASRNLNKLSERYSVILNDPLFPYVSYATYVTDVDRRSSELYIFKETIPFKQLILNGVVDYTTEGLNLDTPKSPRHYLLQALELASYPKATLSYKDSSLLKNSEFNYYYSTQYEHWVDSLQEIYEAYEEAFDTIGTNEIINHEIVGDNVYRTTYRSGVSVIVNYNSYEVVIGEQTIEPLGYSIEGGEWDETIQI